MRLILLGAPGSGKGTLAGWLNSEYGYTHVSTGDILRENIKNETEIGKQVKPLIENGNFVPDEMIIKIVENKLEELQNNYILDGFPRTLNQAIALSENTNIDKVIYLNVEFDEILERLTNRRTCSNPSCKAIYNLNRYEKQTCEKCGSELFQRDDDRAEVITHRFEIFKNQTAPLVNFYKEKGILVEINAKGMPQLTFDQFKKLVDGE